MPVSFTILPASLHELTLLLPSWSRLLGDQAYNPQADEASIWEAVRVRFVPIRKAKRLPNSWEERRALRCHLKAVESVNSQLECVGAEQLYARINIGFDIKL